MTTPLQGLKEAKKLVEAGWCQDAWARKADGTPCDPMDPEAISWCIRGALRKAFNLTNSDEGPSAWATALEYVAAAHGSMDLALYNDQSSRKKEDILDLLSRAIRKAELAE